MHTLDFTLNPQAAERIHDLLSCLSKFSEYVTIEARRNRLILAALNSSKSAYASITLSSGKFFDSYQFFTTNERNLPSTGEDSKLAIRLHVKALLAVFRQRYGDYKGGETSIEKCEVSIDDNPSKPECRLLVKLICKHGVLKKYKLTYEEVEVMHAIFDKELAPHRWRISSKLMKEFMDHFGSRTEQLDISSARERIVLTSYTEKVMSGREILKQPMQTSIVLDASDFEEFSAPDELHIGVSQKDFKAIVTHAESMNGTIGGYFSTAGSPLQMHYECDGMSCEYTLMTLVDVRPSTLDALNHIMSRPPTVFASSSRHFEDDYGTQEQRQKNQENDGPFENGHEPPTQPISAAARAPASARASVLAADFPTRNSSQALFKDFSETEDEGDDLAKHDDDEDTVDCQPTLGWGTSEHNDRPRTARDLNVQRRKKDAESTASEEEEETLVGPTQQVSQAYGLFD